MDLWTLKPFEGRLYYLSIPWVAKLKSIGNHPRFSLRKGGHLEPQIEGRGSGAMILWGKHPMNPEC